MRIKSLLIDDVIERLQTIRDQYGNLEVRHYDRMYPPKPDVNTYPVFTAVPCAREKAGSDAMIVAVV